MPLDVLGGLMTMGLQKVRIKCSEDQRYIAENTMFCGDEFYVLPTERIMIFETIKDNYPASKILNANFDFDEMVWTIDIERTDCG